MKRSHLQHFILSGTLIFALEACVHKPSKTMKPETPIEAASPLPQPPQQGSFLREARLETENLRAELASLKILMAKQAGELRSLRKQSQSVQQREQEQGQQMQNLRSQLLTAQAERDQLRKHNMELEGQVANTPDTSQLVTDIQDLRSSFQKVMTSLKGLSSDITLIKRDMQVTNKNGKPRQTKVAKHLPLAISPIKRSPDANGRITIQEGDTLWHLARAYRVPVDQLREWNNLTSDLIMTGLRLKVADPADSKVLAPAHVKGPTEVVVPVVQHETVEAPSQETPQVTSKQPEEIPSASTHILSIGNSPQVDSDESP